MVDHNQLYQFQLVFHLPTKTFKIGKINKKIYLTSFLTGVVHTVVIDVTEVVVTT